jgi:hypothetical protein
MFDSLMACLRTFQNRKIGRRIAASQIRRHNASIGQRGLNFFIVAKRVFRRNNHSIAPNNAA